MTTKEEYDLASANALGFATVEQCREHQAWLNLQAEQRNAIRTGVHSGLISIGDQVQNIEDNWQGRVTAFETQDGVTMLVCHHVSGGKIELDDKRWFDPRDVRLVRSSIAKATGETE